MSCSCVSASTLNDDNLTSVDTDGEVVESSMNSDILSVDTGSFTDLQHEINYTYPSLILDKDYTYNSAVDSFEGIIIDQSDFTLDGNGHTINGDGKSKIFTITGSNVVLKNLIITNAYIDNMLTIKSNDNSNYTMGNGVAINWLGSDGTLKNTTISNNIVVNSIKYETSSSKKNLCYFIGNGAVYFDRENILVEDCKFLNNQIASFNIGSTDSSIIKIVGLGSALFINNGSNVNIRRTEFINNFAQAGGTLAINNVNNFNIVDSTFKNNTADSNSAGIYVRGVVNKMNVINCNIVDNSASQATAIYFADVVDNINISSNIINNTAVGYTAGVFFNKVATNIYLGGNFTNNYNDMWYGAGAFFGAAVTNITIAGTFKDNEAFRGGAVNFNGAVTNIVVSGTFENNIGRAYGGAIYINGATTNAIFSGIFKGNTAERGGAIWIGQSTNVNISGTFKDNVASVLEGGVIWANGVSTNWNVSGAFENNTASVGSAIFYYNTINNINVSGIFMNNKYGSVITLRSNGIESIDVDSQAVFNNNDGLNVALLTTLTVNNFYNVICEGDELYVQVTLSNNISGVVHVSIADDEIGTINIIDGVGSITISNNLPGVGVWDCIIKYDGDVSLNYSGRVSNQKLTILPSGSTKSFTDLNYEINQTNNVLLEGNYTYMGNDTAFKNGVMLRSNIMVDGQNKTVIDGSGLARIFQAPSNSVNITLKNIKFINAFSSSGYGGAIYFSSGNLKDINILNCTFINNKCTRGSAIGFLGYVTNLNLSGTFISNIASNFDKGGSYGYGTVFFNNKCINANISASFVNNSARDGSSCIYVNGIAQNVIISGMFKDNRRTTCILFTKTYSNIVVCGEFINNTCVISNWAKGENVTINGTFINNSVTGSGGAISLSNLYNVNVSGVFIGNSAAVGGAIYIGTGDNIVVDGAKFEKNHAIVGAGLITGLSNVVIKDTEFTGNSATLGAGLILNSNNASVSNASFNGNNASTGAGLVSTGQAVTISNSSFTNNSASVSGAGLVSTGSDTNIADSSFSGNNATHGGAVYNTGSDFGLWGECNFTDNTAVNDGDISSSKEISYKKYLIMDDIKLLFEGTVFTVSGVLPELLNSSFDVIVGDVKIGELTLSDTSFVYTGSVDFIDQDVSFKLVTYYDGGKYTYTSNLFNIYDSGSFFALNYLINTSDDSLRLSRNYTYDSSTDSAFGDGIVINKTFYLDGNGFTLNALNTVRIFNILADNVKLNNITLINADRANSNGGAIVWYGHYGLINNSVFKNNRVRGSGGGGAIYWIGMHGLINNSIFDNNRIQSGNGGVINVVNTATNLSIYYSNFTNNYAGYHSGAIQWGGVNGTVDGCNFINNIGASYVAGAIYLAGSGGVIKNSNFIANSAPHNNKGSGGALFTFTSQESIVNCTFINNTAFTYGGAVTGGNYFKLIKDCVFKGNKVSGSNADGQGGALQGCPDYLLNCTFEDNYCNYWGGAVVSFKTNSRVENCSFINNTARNRNGGAVYNMGNNVTVIGCNFTNNSANSGLGGVIYRVGNNCKFFNCNFINNVARNSHGGVIYFSDTRSNVTLSFCLFENNYAKYDGGVFYISSTVSNVIINNCIFNNNSAGRNGGAIYWLNSGTLVNCSFYNNTAVTGSAIYSTGILNINNCKFLDNLADVTFTTTKNSNGFSVHFVNNDNYINAIYSSVAPVVSDITYWGTTGVVSDSNLLDASAYHNFNVTLYHKVNQTVIDKFTLTSNSSGDISRVLAAGFYYDVFVQHYTGLTKYRSILFDIPVNVAITKLEFFGSSIVDVGDLLSFVALLDSGATGNVVFSVNGNDLDTVDVVDGRAVLSVDPNLGVGDYVLTAVYNPDGSSGFYGQRNSTNFTVKVKSSALISIIAPESGVNNTILSITAKLNFIAPTELQFVVLIMYFFDHTNFSQIFLY